MFFRVLRRIAQKHLIYHLLIPLIVGMMVEGAFAYFFGHATSWAALIDYLFSVERIGLFVGVFGAYFVIMYLIIRKDTEAGMRRLDLALLEEALKDATSFFSVGTLKLKEWFEPAVQVYLATIIKRQLEHETTRRDDEPPFRNDRVLFFFTKADMKDLDSEYLDGYYAKSFIELHRKFGMQLAYLERKKIFRILSSLSVEDRLALGCYRWPLTWLPESMLKKIPLARLRRRIRKLAFAFIQQADGSKCVLKFSKHGRVVGLVKLDEDAHITLYEALVNKIKREVFRPADGPEVKKSRNFYEYYRL